MIGDDEKSREDIEIGEGFVRVRDRDKKRIVEYRGQIPGGLACTRYADVILRKRCEGRYPR